MKINGELLILIIHITWVMSGIASKIVCTYVREPERSLINIFLNGIKE